MSLDETDTQDLTDELTTFLNDLPDMKDTINKSFVGLAEFLAQPSKDERIETLYQYREENQTTYLRYKLSLDTELSNVYPLVKDLTEAFYLIEHPPPVQQMGQSGVTVNTGQVPQQSVFSKFFRPQQKEQKLDEILENPWRMSTDMIIEAKNIPKVWRKFVRWHESGIIRNHVYHGEGMYSYLMMERWYLKSQVQPEIMKMITSTHTILRKDEIERVAKVLLKAHEMQEKHRGDYQQPQQM